jgi:type 1 glutamine amidotransferase/sugar phosphate isomerase/epimerase
MQTYLHLSLVALLTAAVPQGDSPSETPAVVSIRPDSSRQTRTAVDDLLGWRVGIASTAFPDLTFFEAASKADLLGLAFIEGFSTQRVGPEIPKTLDHHLTPAELAVVKTRLDALNLRMAVYHVDTIGDEETCRKLFDLAKILEVETIVTPADSASLATLDRLANDLPVNVAFELGGQESDYSSPKALLAALDGRGERVGVRLDVDEWVRRGMDPLKALSLIETRLMALDLPDGGRQGTNGGDGDAAASVRELFLAISRMHPPEAPRWLPECTNCASPRATVTPLYIGLHANGRADTFGDLSRAAERFERLVRPAMGYRVNEVSRKMPITPTNRVPLEDRQKIEAALPREAPATPKKPRKLLVIDLCPSGGFYHENIAYTNLALELMAKHTGAYEPVFDNNLDNLKYPAITRFDAVFLNSVVGQVFSDPAVLDGLLRFVREGGGVAGLHGTTYASMNLPAFGEMMGAQDGPHRVEPGTLRIESPEHPLNAGFGGQETFEYTDEYYRFLAEGPYSRETLRVLLSLDVGKTDMRGNEPLYLRPDNDYGLSWIRSYGKGRVFNCALGHTTTMFMTRPLAEHILAGIQFVLGDLDADTTPSARLAARR